MKYSIYRCALALFSAGAILSLVAAETGAQNVQVHVRQYVKAGATPEELSDDILPTGTECESLEAPEIAGWLFTGWTISTTQTFVNRDSLGRALDTVVFTPFEDTSITANYIQATVDDDSDGLADGYELYWFGTLDKSGSEDEDGDGYTVAQEYAYGTNPLLKDEHFNGGVVWADSDERWYNPHAFGWVTFRSDPEGKLFETYSNIVVRGQQVVSPKIDRTGTTFAYWSVNGRRWADRNGRASDQVSFEMGSKSLTVVAVCVEDAIERDQYYWYGKPQSLASDTDGDGYTFAEELAAGMNPLLPDASLKGVSWRDSVEMLYHSQNTRLVTMRSDPEGVLFETTSSYAVIGETFTSPEMDLKTGFAYWTKDGVRVADSAGRAVNTVTFVMPSHDVSLIAYRVEDADLRNQLYWYGAATSMASDTDGDGYTFAEELAAGTNPLMADETLKGVFWGQSTLQEVNLQTYEQAVGTLINGIYVPFFTSPMSGNAESSWTFGANLMPYVFDYNRDGLFDLVLKSDSGTRFFRNVGIKGVPSFTEETGVSTAGLDFSTNAVAHLSAYALDTPPDNALTAAYGDANQDGLSDILVSDTSGRIWYYEADAGGSYRLRNKIWGGTRVGFAAGLRIAAVDWNDDGDLDMLCGTAEGKLMLLNDPRPGHPSNLQAMSGVSDVELTWNPALESRVRGYNVYRSTAGADAYLGIGESSLPAYRDEPENLDLAYDYQVSTVSRHYTAGNSKPTVSESTPTDPVRVTFGKVRFVWRPAAGFIGDVVDVMLAAANAHGLAAENFQLKISYDEAVLQPIEVKKSGLTENLEFSDTHSRGVWIVAGNGGRIDSGSGAFLTFSFRVTDQTALRTTVVKIEDFVLKSIGNGNVIPVLDEEESAVDLSDGEHPDRSYVPAGSLGDLDGDGRITAQDLVLFIRWKDAAIDEIPESVVRAADYNGDGRLNNKDFHLMKKDMRERGVDTSESGGSSAQSIKIKGGVK